MRFVPLFFLLACGASTPPPPSPPPSTTASASAGSADAGPDPTIAKSVALEEARKFGMLGMLEPGPAPSSLAEAVGTFKTAELSIEIFNGFFKSAGFPARLEKETQTVLAFAPTDTAMRALPEPLFRKLVDSTELQLMFLRAHFVITKLPLAEVRALDEIFTANGSVRVTRKPQLRFGLAKALAAVEGPSFALVVVDAPIQDLQRILTQCQSANHCK